MSDTLMHVFFAGGGTGGHLYPALAIARALVAAEPRVRPFFIGARRGIERDVLPTTEFPFELLELHPLYRSQPFSNWRTVVGGVGAWRRISSLIREKSPVALVATGGYVAGVALACASAAELPIVIQEQNSFPGATVRWFAPRATQIHLGFPEAAKHLKLGKKTSVFVTGNPIEPPPTPMPSRTALEEWWGFQRSIDKNMLVFGGSQGAEGINKVVGAWVGNGGAEEANVRVIWATGRGSYDTYKHLESNVVKIRPYIAPMSNAYVTADFAVCRAGAMTTAELAAWGIPAVLVPLPTAAADHQTANAKAIEAAGAAVCIEQRAFTVEALTRQVQGLANNEVLLGTMRVSALQRARSEASQDIVNKILTIDSFK